MPGKRAYSIKVQKKGSSRRKRKASGLEWFVIDTASATAPPQRAERGHRKKKEVRLVRKKGLPSGRGISGEGIYITGEKRTAQGELSEARAKPVRGPKPKRRHPKRRHRNMEK